MTVLKLLLILVLNNIFFIECKCVNSFMTMCDSLPDIIYETPDRKLSWRELLIQGDKYDDLPHHVLTNKHLGDLFNLRRLIISKQLVKIEPLNPLDKVLRNLKSLIICDNNLKFLQTDTFIITSKHLQEVNLQNNQLKNLHPNFLRGRFYIESLNLSRNRLRNLRKGLLWKSGGVSKLDLSHNRVSKIGKFALPPHLKILHLDYNDIYYFSTLSLMQQNLSELVELTISYNKLNHLADLPSLKQLKVLDISFNNIHIIGRSLDNFRNIRLWNFEGNVLTKFVVPPFLKEDQKETYYFLLANNRLRNVKLQPPYGHDLLFTLRGNPWNCRCFEEIERIVENSTNINVRGCDLLSTRSGTSPYCVVAEFFGEECTDEQIPEEQFELFKKMTPIDQKCSIDLYSAHF